MRKAFFFFLGLAFVLGSCEKEIPFKGETEVSKLSLSSLFTSDSVWAVHVGRSLSVLDSGNLSSVSDAVVTINDDQGSPAISLSHQGEGIYTAATEMPVPNRTYTIDVSAPGFAPVKASDAIPGVIQIISLDTNRRRNSDGTVNFDMELTLADPAGISNFYMVELVREISFYDEFNEDTVRFAYLEYLQTSDPNVETEGSFDGTDYEYLLLRDQNIDGQTYTLKFSVPFWEEEDFEDITNTATLSLISSSEAFFNYRRSFLAYSGVVDNPFAQPVQVFSNVEGGFGIFAGGARAIWRIDL